MDAKDSEFYNLQFLLHILYYLRDSVRLLHHLNSRNHFLQQEAGSGWSSDGDPRTPNIWPWSDDDVILLFNLRPRPNRKGCPGCPGEFCGP